jgi:hypothetical protein
MTATISIQYESATFTANTSTVTVGNGGTFQLTDNQFLSLAGTFTFSTLSLSKSLISFYNNSQGTAVNGTASLPVSATTGLDPTIVANNFAGTVILSWPSKQGPQYQTLSPGDQITLTGFTN